MTTWTKRGLPAFMLALGLLVLGSSAALARLESGPQPDGGSLYISQDVRKGVPQGVNTDQALRARDAGVRQNSATRTSSREGVGRFGWEDAGIGAAAGAATTLLIGVMFATARRRLNPLHS